MPSNWISIPLVADDSDGFGASSRLKYHTESRVVVQRDGRAYVPLGDGGADRSLLDHSDVHLLTETEVEELDERLPYSLSSLMEDVNERDGKVGLGDLVAAVTTKLGISECSGCRKRRGWLNRIPVWYRR